MLDSEKPLQLLKHLELRQRLSTVEKSSFLAVWKKAPQGKKIDALIRFMKLNFGVGKLSSNEFIQFGFCNTNIDFEEQSRFVGKRAQQAFNLIYNDKTWYAVTKHKLLFETIMKGANIACPETVTVYDRKGRGSGVPVLKSIEEMKSFLKTANNYPLFAKPMTGLLSIGAFRIDESKGDMLSINGGSQMHVDEVCDYMHKISKKGYLFQKVVKPHPKMHSITANVIASGRFLVFNDGANTMIHSCCLKLPAKGEVADNFWRKGSILCNVDCGSGKIDRAVEKNENHVAEVKQGDALYKSLIGFKLPDFEEAKNVVILAAKQLPGIKVQSWDVAFSDEGPVMLEVNYGGDLNLTQMASLKGVMTKEYRALIEK